MQIAINGKQTQIAESALSVIELLKEQQVKMPEMVSVEHNGVILKRNEFDSVLVKDGDKVEFLYFMGGGKSS